MKRITTVAFIIFNIVYFFTDYIAVTFMPNPVLFGWLPLQLCLLLFFPIIGATVWGIYFNAFFNTQNHVK